ncbi:MAG: hypothetical protein U9R47_08645 [Actinomycetota bacterium]|nr:hypothetical protein [Actinomycetota bacterium]
MQTQPCPSCGRTDCSHARRSQSALYDRDANTRTCVICSGPLAGHTTGEHASRVVERLAALGYPTPVEIDVL